ncbi:hypothetical protein R3X26_16505 [Vibrio sp. TH_r3]|uniref:hypothetical protein n=1 Tax=Vibrio sp. TH_r3 TaxID=3082084 RepID=UPI0029550A21|nr:hypothetical protein [Vibrio sp. TH_r3]MDV7106009.1 hypothetical protein [Vibrio sp. TH_r3]
MVNILKTIRWLALSLTLTSFHVMSASDDTITFSSQDTYDCYGLRATVGILKPSGTDFSWSNYPDSYHCNIGKLPLFLDGSVVIDGKQIQTEGQSITIEGDLTIQNGATIDLDGGNLNVTGNVIQNGGAIYFNGGSLVVGANYHVHEQMGIGNELYMRDQEDYFKVDGDFTLDLDFINNSRLLLLEGTIEIQGNLNDGHSRIYTASNHKILLSGTQGQRVYHEDTRRSYSILSHLEITNTSSQGVQFEAPINIEHSVSASDESVIVGSKNIWLTQQAVIESDWHYDISSFGWVLQNDQTIEGSFHIQSGADINGHSLNVGKDLIFEPFADGALKLSQGEVLVAGNYNVLTIDDDETYCSILMSTSDDYLFINGNLLINGTHRFQMGNGLLELKGDLVVNSEFSAPYMGKVLLSGETKQHITASNLNGRWNGIHTRVGYLNTKDYEFGLEIKELMITNTSVDGVSVDTPIGVKVLHSSDTPFVNAENIAIRQLLEASWSQDLSISKGMDLIQDTTINGNLYMLGGVLDLAGHNLVVEGNLIHSGGDLTIESGTLVVKSDYRIQTVDETSETGYGKSSGRIVMFGSESDYILVEGNFITDSEESLKFWDTSYLFSGVLEVKGDFTKLNNEPYSFFNNITIRLSGDTQQQVLFEGTSEQHSSFYVLELDNTSETGVLFDSNIEVDSQFISNQTSFQLLGDANIFPDFDQDGVTDEIDVFPSDQTEYLDTDNDYIGNNADLDDDNDGVPDIIDLFPLDASESLDTDLDGLGNGIDDDDDNDGVADQDDAFPIDPNEQLDSDGDGIGNNSDPDDDNDGVADHTDTDPLEPTIGDTLAPIFGEIIDVVIEASGEFTSVELSPPAVSDNSGIVSEVVHMDNLTELSVGSHQVIWYATDNQGNVATAIQNIIVQDTMAPELLVSNKTEIQAVDRLTPIDSSMFGSAEDSVDGTLALNFNGEPELPSGTHNIIVWAQDSTGNMAEKEIQLDILPLIQISYPPVIQPNQEIKLSFALLGDAPAYPVTFSYNLDTDLIQPNSGQISIDNDQNRQAELSLTVDNSVLDNASYDLILSDLVNAVRDEANNVTFSVDIPTTNSPPLVDVEIIQGGKQVPVVFNSEGEVTIRAIVKDNNSMDTHNVTWYKLSGDGVYDTQSDSDDTTFTYIPNDSTGLIALTVYVNENNTSEKFSVERTIYVPVANMAPVFVFEQDSDGDGYTDEQEGYQDSDGDGIADYLDNDTRSYVLPAGDNNTSIRVSNNQKIMLGSIARSTSLGVATNSTISLDDIIKFTADNEQPIENVQDEGFDYITPIYNMVVTDIENQGDSISILIELDSELPPNAIVRKYHLDLGWYDFVEDSTNSIYSSALIKGECPSIVFDNYQSGLIEGSKCLLLTIEDGGPNDFDSKVNGIVEDPVVLAQITDTDNSAVEDEEIVTHSSSSGGSLSFYQLLFLCMLIGSRRYRHVIND